MTNEWRYTEYSVRPTQTEICKDAVRLRRDIREVERTDENTQETITIWTAEEQIVPRVEYEAREWVGKTEAQEMANAAEDRATTTAFELALELIGGE